VIAFIASFMFGLGRDRSERPVPRASSTPTPLAVPDSRLRVQVLNASRKTGMARQATDRLRAAGYDVVSIGNARSRRAESVVLDRVGQPELAERVAASLGIARVETQRDTTLYLEVTVILGADWPE
jgi:hypothetical protein